MITRHSLDEKLIEKYCEHIKMPLDAIELALRACISTVMAKVLEGV